MRYCPWAGEIDDMIQRDGARGHLEFCASLAPDGYDLERLKTAAVPEHLPERIINMTSSFSLLSGSMPVRSHRGKNGEERGDAPLSARTEIDQSYSAEFPMGEASPRRLPSSGGAADIYRRIRAQQISQPPGPGVNSA